VLTAVRSLKVKELDDGHRRIGLAQGRYPVSRGPGGCRRRWWGDPGTLYREAGLLPGSPAAAQCRYLGYTLFQSEERRTGALVLRQSGTVKDNQRLVAKGEHSLSYLVQRQ
jgi:hypothetical protein